MSFTNRWSSLVVGGLCATAAIAQPPPPAGAPGDRLFVIENLRPLPAMGATIDILGSEAGVPGPVVTGKPYSARSVTESTQTLADGNRITRRNEAVVHRDGEGRTRREQTLSDVGVWRADEPVTMINIYDPVAGKSYALDPASRTAREIRPFQVAIAHAEQGPQGMRTEVRGAFVPGVPVPPPPGAGIAEDVTIVRRSVGDAQVGVFATAPGSPLAAFAPIAAGAVATEDIGEQVLEGLLVKGTRMTNTIPAGAIGNERAIEVVTERWYSQDIDAIVLQRFSDPRVGETTYRLVNVVRGEPAPELFQVPQGYEIVAPELARPRLRAMPGAPGRPGPSGEPREEAADER
jgi:hypothetical protein